jgi:uncharacterized protein involved in exopolysaccharide biosynthesis
MEAMSKPPKSHNRLSDPAQAAHAWARYRWIMRWVIAAAMLSVAAALLYLKSDGSTLTATMIIATSAGVAFSVLLAGALMGLIFLSSGTGHDEDVAHFDEEEEDNGRRWDKRR